MIRNAVVAAAATLLTLTAPARAAESGWHLLNMTEGVTDISREIYDLHMLIFWVCVIIGLIVFGWMIWSLVAFRKSKGAVADTTLVHDTRVEIIWTVIPVAILVAMAVPAAKTLVQIEDTRNTELNIKVTGYQWGWHYEYLTDDPKVSFFSRLDRQSDAARQLASGVDPHTIPNYLLNVDNPLVVPAGVKVRLLVTASDVIHAWWVPAFGMKKDAIPGFVNEMWFKVDADKTGTYRGQCTELCGRDHAFMPIVVDVKSKDEFDAWLRDTAARQQAQTAPAPADTQEAQAAATPAPANAG